MPEPAQSKGGTRRRGWSRKRKRMVAVLALVGGLGVATALVLNAFSDNLVFFHRPSDVVEQHVAAGKRFRIGGLVEAGSVKKEGRVTGFDLTDIKKPGRASVREKECPNW